MPRRHLETMWVIVLLRLLPKLRRQFAMPHDSPPFARRKSADVADDQVGASTTLAVVVSHTALSAWRVLACLADSAALAIRNLQLYGELSEALERERQARIAAEAARATAERATATKDEFLALVAHELRQPLHASIAALRIMEARPSRESGAHARAR